MEFFENAGDDVVYHRAHAIRKREKKRGQIRVEEPSRGLRPASKVCLNKIIFSKKCILRSSNW